MDSLRVAVIGAGALGNNHLRVLHNLPGVVISAVVDSNPGRAADAAAKYGCPALYSPFQLKNEIDAAIVAVPTVDHAAVACELLERGIDVLVEKPIAPDLESARRIAETAKRTQFSPKWHSKLAHRLLLFPTLPVFYASLCPADLYRSR